MRTKMALRVCSLLVALSAFGFGLNFALNFLASELSELSISSIIPGVIAFSSFLICAIAIKAASAWEAEINAEYPKWKASRDYRRWQKRTPDAWWIERFPYLMRYDNPFRLMPVPPKVYREFVSELAAKGYGPHSKDPAQDGAVDLWFEERQSREQ